MCFREQIFKSKWSLFHHTAFDVWNQLQKNEYRSIDQLLHEQNIARKKIVRAAFKNTVFYRKHYSNSGFELGDMEHPGWFELLPIVTKKELRAFFDDFCNPVEKEFLKCSTTGGSTGTPTRTGYDRRIPEEVYSWRLQSRFGVNPWDHHAYVWRDTRKKRLAKIKNAVMWWPTKHLKLDASFLSDDALELFIHRYNKLKPSLLQGYVGAITLLAQYIIKHQIKVWSPKVVWTTSAPLPKAQRRLIEQAFATPVCDEYGSCELRWIASQCPECQGLHVNVEHVFIEFVDSDNKPVENGVYGRTLLTNLQDETFPLIRYENNDRGRWLSSPCPCGRTLPCIDSVKGREVESFQLPSGKIINGEYLTTIFDSQPELVISFSVIQHKDLSITVEYIPSNKENIVAINASLADFSRRIGGEVNVTGKLVEQLRSDKGKLRFVIKER